MARRTISSGKRKEKPLFNVKRKKRSVNQLALYLKTIRRALKRDLLHIVWKLLKVSHLNFYFWHFPPNLSCLVTLFDRKLQIFKNSPKWTILGIFNKLLSTQNVNVARFAHNVEWDFFCDFQTPCPRLLFSLRKTISTTFVLFTSFYNFFPTFEIPQDAKKKIVKLNELLS